MFKKLNSLARQLQEIRSYNDPSFPFVIDKIVEALNSHPQGETAIQKIERIDYIPTTQGLDENFHQKYFKNGINELNRILNSFISHNMNFETDEAEIEKINIFISHSSEDRIIAKGLADLLKYSIDKENLKIRCSSVNGYMLPVGTSIGEQLRKEIFVADIFLGLITRHSIVSTYVLFELGARWGVKRAIMPVVTHEKDYGFIKAPLSDYNVLNIGQTNHINQLLFDISNKLECRIHPAHTTDEFTQKLKASIVHG